MTLTSVESAHSLISQHQDLSSLTAAMKWRSEADFTMTLLEASQFSTQERLQEIAKNASTLRLAAKEQSFWGIFLKSASEKAANIERTGLLSLMQHCRHVAIQLQEIADETPATDEEYAQLVKDLKATKKRLQIQKKEVSLTMKDIRTTARQKSDNAASIFTDKKTTSDKRLHIRHTKEQALTPHEGTKSGLDRKILAIEKKILLMESYR